MRRKQHQGVAKKREKGKKKSFTEWHIDQSYVLSKTKTFALYRTLKLFLEQYKEQRNERTKAQ